MREKSNYTQKILAFCKDLPECCSFFLLETDTEKEYSTLLEYAKELTCFFSYLVTYIPELSEKETKEVSLEDLKKLLPKDISRYLSHCKGKGLKTRTLMRKRAALSSFFSCLRDNRMLEFNPVSGATKVKLKDDNPEVIYLDVEEQNRFLQDIDSGDRLTKTQQKYHEKYKNRDYALIMLLLDTGMRVSELQGTDIPDFDFDHCSVIIRRKGGKFATLYYSDEARDAILLYLQEREDLEGAFFDPNGPLFVTKRRTRLAVRSIEVLVKKYATSSIPGKGQIISPHKMRTSFAMTLYSAEKDLLLVQKKLGHKNIQTTTIYAKASDQQMQETRSILSEIRNKEVSDKK